MLQGYIFVVQIRHFLLQLEGAGLQVLDVCFFLPQFVLEGRIQRLQRGERGIRFKFVQHHAHALAQLPDERVARSTLPSGVVSFH